MRHVLAPNGVFVMEVHDLGATLQDLTWDTIYHEHSVEWSTRSLRIAGAMHGLHLTDIYRLPLHGGLLRAVFEPGPTERRPSGTPWLDYSRLQRAYDTARPPALPPGAIAYGAAARATVYLDHVQPERGLRGGRFTAPSGSLRPGGRPAHPTTGRDGRPARGAHHGLDTGRRHQGASIRTNGRWVTAWQYIVFVGAYAYARRVLDALPEPPLGIVTTTGASRGTSTSTIPRRRADLSVRAACMDLDPDLVVVAGWRQLVPIVAPTVGFHSAKLPEYPGRAPVPNAILRGDRTLTNTMLWLDDGVDTGDIIDEWEFPITGRTPDDIYREIGETSALMLRRHWDGLLDGTAPRRPQDVTKRGPLTPADAWRDYWLQHQADAFG